MKKNHYQVLHIFPGSSIAEIKKAYRKLALRFHPDKNPGDHEMAERFLEIIQAYEILTDPEKRTDYDRKQGFPSPEEVASANPREIHRQSKVLRKYLDNLNLHSLDREALLFQMEKLLSERNIDLMVQSNDTLLMQDFFSEIMKMAKHLDFSHMTRLLDRLLLLTSQNQELSRELELMLSQKKNEYLARKYMPLFVLIITLLLCWMIYLSGRN